MGNGRERRYGAAGVVLSDRAAAGDYVDRSGPVLREYLDRWGCDVRAVEVIADDGALLSSALERWLAAGVRLVLTSGGTGLGPRDVTPQVLEAWADYAVPGIGEWMRVEGAKHTSAAWISRGGAWVKDRMLVAALPGSPRALEEILGGLGPIVEHALRMIEGGGHGP